MEEPFENEEDQLNDQRAENEIKKIKLSLEHGMDFSKSFTNPDMPPEIEGEFLDYIQQWEDQFAQRKMITVYDLAGRPDCMPAGEIADSDIGEALDKLMGALHEKSISVDTICEVEERELYRFITEELFKEETDDIQIPGMMHCFTYEEYHPNHVYDIKRRCEDFVKYVFNKDEDPWEPMCIGKTIQHGGIVISKNEFSGRLKNFRDSFSEFECREFEVISVALNENADEGVARYRMHYTGKIEGTSEEVEFKGECVFSVTRDDEWWYVTAYELPGVGGLTPALSEGGGEVE